MWTARVLLLPDKHQSFLTSPAILLICVTIRACCLLPVPWDGLSHCCFAEYFEVPAGFLTFVLRIINRPWLVVHCFVGNDLFLQLEVWRKDNCCLSLSETFETQSLTGTGKVDKT